MANQLILPAATEALATVHAPTVAQMMNTLIERGVTPENASVLEKFMDLHERMEARAAERAFAEAFVQVQSEMPRIEPDKMVPDNNGNQKFRFASYEQIVEKVKPLLLKHGFTVSFSMDFQEGRVIQKCTLQHIGGHSRTNSFAARIGKGPPGASETQADGAASTYAKRFALCNALNITIDNDTDGRNDDLRKEGDLISPDKVAYLNETIKELNLSETYMRNWFLLAGVQRVEDIREGSYAVLSRLLNSKRSK